MFDFLLWSCKNSLYIPGASTCQKCVLPVFSPSCGLVFIVLMFFEDQKFLIVLESKGSYFLKFYCSIVDLQNSISIKHFLKAGNYVYDGGEYGFSVWKRALLSFLRVICLNLIRN